MFLREGGENEVRLGNGKESTVCLRALAAPEAARTDGNLGLLNLVPRTLRVEFGVDEAGQTLLLIRLEDVDSGDEKDRPQTYGREQGHGQPLPPLQSAQKHTHGGNREVGKRGTQVWLFQDHQHGDTNDRRG